MKKIVMALFFSLLISNLLLSQIFPKESQELNYRLIGFTFAAKKNTTIYTIEIATGNYNNEDSFKRNIIASEQAHKNRIIAEVPAFHKQYTWRIKYTTGNSGATESNLLHFSTGTIHAIDTSMNRLKLIKPAEKYKDAYVFLDGTGVLYDMDGMPVWYLPVADTASFGKNAVRDIKLTPHGTVTFISPDGAYEVNYSGKVLCHLKDKKTNQAYNIHNEFTRLGNGHYMGIGTERVYWKLPQFKDSFAKNAADSARFYLQGEFGTIVEMDKNSNIIWQWKCSDYAKKSDLFQKKERKHTNFYTHMHENSFYFDEKNKAVYLSFRNINRVIKIKYPEGNVLYTFGTKYKKGVRDLSNGLFCGQHSCRYSANGYIYLYDNNTCEKTMPKIVLLKESSKGGDMEKIWEYQCSIDDSSELETGQQRIFPTGGNVLELKDQDMFISMSEPYPKVFIVSHDKKILWNATPQKYNPDKRKWEVFTDLYRASIIPGRKALEQLIWNSENIR